MSDAGVIEVLLDPACGGAESLCRETLLGVAQESGHVGVAVAIEATGELTAVHRFECTHPGYVGWNWAVAVSRAPGSDDVTIDELWLEPGDGALLTPAWRPWSERVMPGDLGVGDIFPTAADDPRLTAGFTAEDDTDSVVADQPLHPLQWELGLGRERVLSALGREDAAERWFAGDSGPDSPLARAATDRCVTCGWLMPLGGSLGQAFGVCAQPMSPSDGRVVALQHGCGAHSEVVTDPNAAEVVEVIVDDVDYDPLAVEDEAVVDAELEAEVDAELEAVVDAQVEAVVDDVFDAEVESESDAEVEAVVEAEVEAQPEPEDASSR